MMDAGKIQAWCMWDRLAEDGASAGNKALEGEMMSEIAADKLDMPEIHDVHNGKTK